MYREPSPGLLLSHPLIPAPHAGRYIPLDIRDAEGNWLSGTALFDHMATTDSGCRIARLERRASLSGNLGAAPTPCWLLPSPMFHAVLLLQQGCSAESAAVRL